MSEIKIKCPTCGKILRLQDSTTINNASFTCPVCNEKHIVGQCQRYVEQPKSRATGEETQYAGSGGLSIVGEETQIYSASQAKVGTLVDSWGRTYQLRIGVNSIGRKASTSPATVQINTDDRTMSRNHAIIEVRNTCGQIIHILKNSANKNFSYHNGVVIGATDQLILNNGDTIKFGNTVLTFKK